jgi:hypothetical protein
MIMEMIGVASSFAVGVAIAATFIWIGVTTYYNENSIGRLWDENRKLKDRISDLENKPARKTR